jgi:catechol 2,3-dioxygenase-like lactoylglutathione lyase family enzyme
MLGSHKLVAFIPTRNRDAAKTFYKDVLGLRLVSEDQFAMVFDANGTMLRVTPVPEYKPHPFTILGWQTNDIDKSVTELDRKGVRCEHFKLPGQDDRGIWSAQGGARIAWFKDPDGNLLSVSQHE